MKQQFCGMADSSSHGSIDNYGLSSSIIQQAAQFEPKINIKLLLEALIKMRISELQQEGAVQATLAVVDFLVYTF
jgi:hypothetical protein